LRADGSDGEKREGEPQGQTPQYHAVSIMNPPASSWCVDTGDENPDDFLMAPGTVDFRAPGHVF
jgi:hypothetical protein